MKDLTIHFYFYYRPIFIVFTIFAKSIRSRKVYKNLRQLLKIKGQKDYLEISALPSSYFASILIVKYFAHNTAFFRYSDKFLLNTSIYTD